MTKAPSDDVLRARALQVLPPLGAADAPAPPPDRLLQELDVYRTELEIQNEDLRLTQQALETARDRYQLLFDQATVPLLSLATDGLIVEANQAAAELLQRERHRLLGRAFLQFIAESDQSRWVRQVEQAHSGGPSHPFEVSLVPRHDEIKLVVAHLSLLHGGPARQLICQLRDVTAERRAERDSALMQQRLFEAEKLEAVGSVAAAISHDVNNVITSIVSLAEFSRASVENGSQLAQDLDALLDSAWQATRLVRGLLGFSRSSRRPPRVLDVSAIVQRVVSALVHKKPGVALSLEVGTGKFNVLGDPDDLYQALLNVAVNGIDAMAAGTLTLSCERTQREAEPVIRIRVKDEGCGMDEATQRRIFEPLFTTKGPSGGSGLGMTIVRRVISAHRGRLELESAVGHGTAITIELPADDTEVATAPPPATQVPTLDGLRVLLVDDDASVRHATKRQLQTSGATVHALEDGDSALRAIVAGLKVDVAVIDVNMPVLSGPDLVSRLQEVVGKFPVLFVTGGTGELVPESWLREPRFRLLKKPWARRDLVEAVLDVFRRSGAAAVPA